MTNWQPFFAAGLPTLTVLLSIWRADKRADQIGARQDRTDAAIAGNHSSINNRLDTGIAGTNARIDRIADDMKQFYMILGKHEGRIDNLEKK